MDNAVGLKIDFTAGGELLILFPQVSRSVWMGDPGVGHSIMILLKVRDEIGIVKLCPFSVIYDQHQRSLRNFCVVL